MEPVDAQPHIVDFATVAATECLALWDQEVQWWRTHLRWDITESIDALQRVVARGGVSGKAVRVGQQIVGYMYYRVEGALGLLSALTLAPAWNRPDIGALLVQAVVETVRQHGARRIESPCIAPAAPWLVPTYTRVGFRSMPRAFLRVDLAKAQPLPIRSGGVTLHAWQGAPLHAVASLMQAAYQRTVDAELNQLYRTVAGCHEVCDQLFTQGSCGPFVASASALAQVQGHDVGFLLTTAIAPRQAHLAQVAVLPAYQRRGVGRQLVAYCVAQLSAQHFDTLSLVVSCTNTSALALYQALGMREILTFPVFVWEDVGSSY